MEARRKRRGGLTPLRPYGWESVEMSSIPQVVRDQANMGTLQERRRRAKPLNPYYDAKYDYYDETQVRMTALLAYNLAIVDCSSIARSH